MKNPWTTKNPLMSMWLSAANRSVGAARGQGAAAGKRQIASAQSEFTRQMIDLWSGGKPARKRTRRK